MRSITSSVRVVTRAGTSPTRARRMSRKEAVMSGRARADRRTPVRLGPPGRPGVDHSGALASARPPSLVDLPLWAEDTERADQLANGAIRMAAGAAPGKLPRP